MKKQTKKHFFLAGGICCCAGILFFGAGMLLNGKEYVKETDLSQMNANAKLESTVDATTSTTNSTFVSGQETLESFSSIQTDFSIVTLYIKPSEDDTFSLSYHLKQQDGTVPLSFDVKNGILSIKDTYHRTDSVSLDFSGINSLFGNKDASYENEVTLYLPKGTVLKNGDIALDVGNFSASDCSADSLEIKMDTGDASFTNCTLNTSSDIHLSCGNIALTDCNFAGKNSITLDCGDFDCRTSSIKNGDISLACGDFDCKTSSFENGTISLECGDVSAEESVFIGNTFLSNSLGDIELSLTKKAAGETFVSAQLSLGEISVSDSLSTSKADASNVITIQSSCGDVTVK